MSKTTDMAIDKMNESKTIVLGPHDLWIPDNTVKAESKPEPCLHDWHKVLLFTSTVEECKKCGKLRDK